MRRILTIVVSALMLSACMANWPSNNHGPRWTGGPGTDSSVNGGNTPTVSNSGSAPGVPGVVQ
jgi:hypothetical protein